MSATTPPGVPLDAAALAEQHGLKRLGARPPLGEYLRQIWDRRHFLWAHASAKSYSKNQNNYLGQVWAVLNPLMLALVYWVVFGLILETTQGVTNFVGYLVIGIFIFQFVASSITAGSGAINNNISLVRALRFPRAVLPLSVALSELLTLAPALVVMLIIVVFRETPTWDWLMLPVAILIIAIFNAGCALVASRLVVGARDLRNLIPVAVRLLRYVSGVFFVIEAHTEPDDIGSFVMQYQPVSVYLNIVRQCLLREDAFTFEWSLWAWGIGWAVLLFVVGFIVFWRAEERYGRD